MSGQSLYITILNSNLINFILMISILVWIFKHFKLGKLIDNMAYDIKNNVTTSAEAVKKALNEYKKTKKDSKSVDIKKEEIINEAKAIISKLDEKNKLEIEEKKNIIELNGEKLKSSYLEQTKEKTAKDINDAVYLLSLETVVDMMNDELQIKIINEALDELDKTECGVGL